MNASLKMSYLQARNRAVSWIARHLPKRLCYWAALHVAAEAGCYDEFQGEDVPALSPLALISAYHEQHLEKA